MKFQHLDIIALENILGREVVCVPRAIPEVVLGLLNYSYDYLIEILASTVTTPEDLNEALEILDSGIKAGEIFENECTRDQVDEMIRLGLLDPAEVEKIDLIGAEQTDINRRLGLPADLEYFVFCCPADDMSSVIIALGVSTLERDSDIVRELLDKDERRKALDYLTAIAE